MNEYQMNIIPTCKYCSRPIKQDEIFCNGECKQHYDSASFKEFSIVAFNSKCNVPKKLMKWKNGVGVVVRVNKHKREVVFRDKNGKPFSVVANEDDLVGR